MVIKFLTKRRRAGTAAGGAEDGRCRRASAANGADRKGNARHSPRMAAAASGKRQPLASARRSSEQRPADASRQNAIGRNLAAAGQVCYTLKYLPPGCAARRSAAFPGHFSRGFTVSPGRFFRAGAPLFRGTFPPFRGSPGHTGAVFPVDKTLCRAAHIFAKEAFSWHFSSQTAPCRC